MSPRTHEEPDYGAAGDADCTRRRSRREARSGERPVDRRDPELMRAGARAGTGVVVRLVGGGVDLLRQL
jgi:hypothetical protein